MVSNAKHDERGRFGGEGCIIWDTELVQRIGKAAGIDAGNLYRKIRRLMRELGIDPEDLC